MNLSDAVELIQMEYLEMPELKLTFWQARRLWNTSNDLCDRALSALVRAGFLAERPGVPPLSGQIIESFGRPV